MTAPTVTEAEAAVAAWVTAHCNHGSHISALAARRRLTCCPDGIVLIHALKRARAAEAGHLPQYSLEFARSFVRAERERSGCSTIEALRKYVGLEEVES